MEDMQCKYVNTRLQEEIITQTPTLQHDRHVTQEGSLAVQPCWPTVFTSKPQVRDTKLSTPSVVSLSLCHVCTCIYSWVRLPAGSTARRVSTLLQPAKIQPDVPGREIATRRTTAAGRPDLLWFSKSLSFVMCDDTSACNQVPSLTLLNNTSAGTGTPGSGGRTATATAMARYAHLRESGLAVGQQKRRHGGVDMHARQPRNCAVKLTSNHCSLLHVTKSGSMHNLLRLGPMHTCPSRWRSRLPAAVTGHASPDKLEQGDTCIHLDFYRWERHDRK